MSDEFTFAECGSCSRMPGVPFLCASCGWNRRAITHLTQERDEARGERDAALRAVRDGFPATVEVIRAQRDEAIAERDAEREVFRERCKQHKRDIAVLGLHTREGIRRDTAEAIALWIDGNDIDPRWVPIADELADAIRNGSYKPAQGADAAVREGK